MAKRSLLSRCPSYLPTEAQENCFKMNIKIYIKTFFIADPTIYAATPPN